MPSQWWEEDEADIVTLVDEIAAQDEEAQRQLDEAKRRARR